MLVFLPLLVLGMVFLSITQIDRAIAWKQALLRAFSIVGFYGICTLESLSLFNQITKINLAIAWSLPLLFLSGFLIYKFNRGLPLRLPSLSAPDRFESIGYAVLIIILVCTAIVAWYSPPQTWDSLNYHMSRVAHWAQNQSLKPFATGIEIQNSNMPGAEVLFLHSYILATGDRFVNFVEWLAMIASSIGVAIIAEKLGGRRYSSLIAAIFTATLPMGIIQASSTMNDYVVALWVIGFVTEAIQFTSNKGGKGPLVMMAMNIGLAILTKPTAYTFVLPFLLLVILVTLRASIWRTHWRQIAIGILLVAVLNVPHFLRTTQVYGSIFDPNQLDTHSNQAKNLAGLVSNTVRNLSLHLGTPSPYINKGITLAIRLVHQVMGISINDPRTTAHTDFKINLPSTNEIKSGNSLHMYAFMIIFLVLLSQRKKFSKNVLIYSGLSLSTFLVFSFIFKWQLFGSRYHIPFFVLIAPIVGVVLSTCSTQLWRVGYLIFFFILSIPWLVSIESRPILPTNATIPRSIFIEDRKRLYFGSLPSLAVPYDHISRRIRETECHQVGIAIGGNSAEYPFWVFLGAPTEDIVIEWIVGGTASAKFRDPAFNACAIICDRSCPQEWQEVNGLPLADQITGYRLFFSE